MAPPAPDAAGLAQLLALSKVGTFSLPIANLQHTAIGRPLHRVGVSSIRTSIEDQGWLDSKMTACLVGPTPVGGLEAADVAEQQQYRILDGNHRLAALLEIEAERKKADPSCEPTFIGVEVHVGMSLEKERIVASSLNNATELVVKTTLSDRVLWYKAWHDDIQLKSKAKAPLSSNAVANRLNAISKQTGVLAASLPTIKDYMKIVQAVKTRALAALHDVTHLPGRPDGHVDVKDGLRASRITVKSFLRPEFAALSDTQQEAYVYRLASGGKTGAFTGVMSADDYLTLDEMAKDVARMVDSAETHLGPVSEWSDSFKCHIAKARNYEGSSKFVTHFNGRVSAAEKYKLALPPGLAPDATYVEWIKSQPWSPLLTAIKGTESSPSDMQGVYDTYNKIKDDKKNEAEAAVGRFKTKLAEQQKAATDAAAAATAAAAAAALAKSAEEAATSAKDAAASSEAAAQATVQATAEAPAAKTPAGDTASSPAARAAGSVSGAAAKEAVVQDLATKEIAEAMIVGAKRKAEHMSATATAAKKARPIMTKLVSVDILGDPLDTDVEIQHPDGQPFMLAFVNIAANASVLAADGGSVLKSALTFLSNNLHERGTIVIALPDWEFPRTMLKAWFKEACLILEDSPVVSLYLHGKSGRPAEKDLYVYPTQGAVTLLAHKNMNFICNGGGPRSRGGEPASRAAARGVSVAAPRTLELDRIGAVVSLSHPPTGTNLPEATAELLIKRFSDVGDAVLVSAGLRDTSLAHTALLAGRTLVVLEPDVVNIDKTAAALDDMTASASKSGIWARMLSKPLVTVGPGRRPILVPASNIPTSTAEKVEQARQGGDEHPERTVAKGHAANHGLEIKGSKLGGLGLFATKSLSGAPGVFLKIPLVGRFEVHDSVEDSVEAGKDDGLPRFLFSDNMALFLSDGEIARPNAGLYIVPDKTSPLCYLNSSCTDPESENFTFMSVLRARDFKGMEDKELHLRNAMHSVQFDLSRNVDRGTELLAFYTLRTSAVSP